MKNCIRCGRLYIPKDREKHCPICIRELESHYDDVREYLRDFPGASLDEVSAATGVDEATIARFIDEGRIEILSYQSKSGKRCQRCDIPIKAGRYCSRCQEELAQELRGAAKSLSLAEALRPNSGAKSHANKNKVFSNDLNKRK
ncbi:hypothetical protein [Heliophilum fasciatum]|uniref:Flagellar operon protein (TIGR03826 family) n=1 Tax=Heliophilum fasciatum TaxID=35700 RepID=A0A4R2RN38_9FIRM|nr:hypothetical protein [Heliophilum fasciatum]MCW2278825.1 putative amidophosphoribosyltransferase [Heliophilum fasciatum]TCP64089.1 hypothetical protein EDD73_11250 [Heliophilum fasciatum]